MSFLNMLIEARKLETKELERHALVSTRNRHECKECFCCACNAVLKARKRGADSAMVDSLERTATRPTIKRLIRIIRDHQRELRNVR